MKKMFVLFALLAIMAAVAMPILAQDRPLISSETQETQVMCSVGSGCAESRGTERMLTFEQPAGAEIAEIQAWCVSTGSDEPDERASLTTTLGTTSFEFTCPDPGAPPMSVQMTFGGESILSGAAQTLTLMARNIGTGYTNSMKVVVSVNWYGAAPTEEPTATFTPTNTPEPTVVSTETPEMTETPTFEPTMEVTDEPTVEVTDEATLPPPTEIPLPGQCVAIPSETLPQGLIPWESATWEDGRHFGNEDGEYAFVSEKGEIVLNFSPTSIKGNSLSIQFGETIITVNVELNSCEIPAEQLAETVIEPTSCPIDGCEDPNNETPNNIGRRWEYNGQVYVESFLLFFVNGETAESRLYNGERRYFAYGLSPNDTIVGVAGIMDYGPCSLTIQPIMFAGDETNISIPKLPSMWEAIWEEWALNMGFREEYIYGVLLPMVEATALNGMVVVDLNEAR